jgi:hypothetical protein
MPSFKFGARSREKMRGLHPHLVRVLERAIEITPIDFSVTDGVRTLEEQRQYVELNASHALDSRHLTGHAVDIAAFVANSLRYEEKLLCDIALAMRSAAKDYGIPLGWGGLVGGLLSESTGPIASLVEDSRAMLRDAGKATALDLNHFELPELSYPADAPARTDNLLPRVPGNSRGRAQWFIDHFGERIKAQVTGTPFSVAMLTAIALKETGYIWKPIVKDGIEEEAFLLRMVGDSLDYKPATDTGRKAFPKNRAELIGHAHGQEMFAIARGALERLAQDVPGYAGAIAQPNKFARGYGVFQYDLQFFKDDPDYFLSQSWSGFDACLGKALGELQSKFKSVKARHPGLGLKDGVRMSHDQSVAVAIAYNRGSYDAALGLKQGHPDGAGMHYGTLFDAELRLCSTLTTD